MYDFRKFDANSLKDFYIYFDNSEEAEQFAYFVRKELDNRIDERVISDLSKDKLLEFNSLKNKEQKHDWLSKNCPQFEQIRKEEYVRMAWEIYTNREQLDDVTIFAGDYEEIRLDSLGFSKEDLSFFRQYGWKTVADILNYDAFDSIEKIYPERVYHIKSRIMDAILPTKKMSLDDVFEEHKHDSPEVVLNILHQHILNEAEAFRKEDISENEFYVNTYPILIANKTFKLKNNATVKTSCTQGDAMMACWKNWKAGNRVTEEPWMSDFINQDGNMEETMTWLFEICDKLAIPIIYYFDLQYFSDSEGEFEYPRVIKDIQGETEAFMLIEKCTDIEKINTDVSLINKSIDLHFDHGTSIHLKVEDVMTDRIICEGLIDGYMSTQGLIEIKIENDRKWFYFNKRKFPRINTILQSGFHPIPHSKWKKYNEAIHKKGFQFEAEYKQLRLPFMLDKASL